MDNPASASDVADRWRTLTDAEASLADVLLGDAWELVRARVSNLDALNTAGTVTDGNVLRILCAMVLRVLKNGDGWREVSIDDYRRVRDVALSSGLLYLAADEFDTLQGTTGVGAFTITPVGSSTRPQPDLWFPTVVT